ncbi:MAG: ATPase [Kiritimatiellaeota bacterium]|nr:ATPase [Kiritimatiellota bacterium]
MKIAIPTAEGKLAMHFGHCEKFVIIEVEDGKIVTTIEATPPPHEPGVLPKWLHEEQNVNAIIAGGMGQRAQQLFAANEIEVLVGASALEPETLVKAYIDGSLVTGDNICDH